MQLSGVKPAEMDTTSAAAGPDVVRGPVDATKVRVVAEKVLDSAKRFQKSVEQQSLDAFTSEEVKQLQAAVDELVEISVVKLDPGSTAFPARHVEVPEVVNDLVEAADRVLEGVIGDAGLTIAAEHVHAVASLKNKILYVVQVVAAQVDAKKVVEVANSLSSYTDVKVLEPLRSATLKVLEVVQDVPALPAATALHVEASAAKAEVIEAAKGFQSLVEAPNNLVKSVRGKQDLVDAATKLRVATNKAQLYAKVETLRQEVLAAAKEFKDSYEQKGLVAYTDTGVSRLQYATKSLLAGLRSPAAATELAYGTVDISRALGEIELAASGFDGVRSNEALRVLVEGIHGATNRVVHGNKPVKPAQVVLDFAANEVLDAAKKFQDLVNQNPLAKDQAVAALENIRRAADNVLDPEPKVSRAAKKVVLAAQAFHDWASLDRFEFRGKLTQLHETIQEAVKCVDEGNVGDTAYKEAVNLSLIKLDSVMDDKGQSRPKYPVHKAALEDWEQKDRDLLNKVSRREARSADVTNHIFNIIGWYAVFLGVVLTAVSQLVQTQSNTTLPAGSKVYPLCGKIWFPIVLTLFGTVVTIGGIAYKFKILKSLEITIHTEKRAQSEFERRINTLRRKGPECFNFTTDIKESSFIPSKRFAWDIFLVVGAIVALTGLFILSYVVILCNKLVVG